MFGVDCNLLSVLTLTHNQTFPSRTERNSDQGGEQKRRYTKICRTYKNIHRSTHCLICFNVVFNTRNTETSRRPVQFQIPLNGVSTTISAAPYSVAHPGLLRAPPLFLPFPLANGAPNFARTRAGNPAQAARQPACGA